MITKAEVHRAADRLYAAEDGLFAALQLAYPFGSSVMVRHSRGAYTGRVTGHSLFGHRVFIRNDDSGKMTRVYFDGVECLSNQTLKTVTPKP